MLRFRASLAASLFFLLAGSASAIIVIGGKGYALLPLASGQVGRIYVSNYEDPNENNVPCGVIVDWFAADGSAIGDPGILEVRPQTLRFLDFLDRTVAAGGRRTVRAVVELDPRFPANHCVVQEAIFDLSTGRPQLLGDPKVLPQGQSPPEPDSP